jgi:hypothetical protein
MIADLSQQGGGEDEAVKRQRTIEAVMRRVNVAEQKLKTAQSAVTEAQTELVLTFAELRRLAR